ncbi:MAG: STAS domain-containing protein [Leptolyngbya sp. SIO1D8]|nr:STAS domain-containing protein [Leptolyngbya sp. SIO1D8]
MLSKLEFLETAPLKIDCADGSCVIRLPVSLTVTEAVSFQKACQELFNSHPDLRELFLDFSETLFIDSSGVGSLVICRRLCGKRQTELQLRDVGPQVMMALAITDLDKVFTITQKEPDKPLPSPNSQTKHQMLSMHPSVSSRAKRAMDIVGSIVGLGITAILFIPIAIAIKLEDGGPIFFRQTRCSWMGKRFLIWKFRSMVVDAEALKHKVENEVEGPLFKSKNDSRITRIGKFLRKTSLDEFPQFWNVLKGEMSLVGTRPPTPDEIEHYEVPAWQRLDVKPGLTGEWQVNGRSNIKNFEDVIRLDLKYQANWSLLYDIKLIIKTIRVIFTSDSGAA